jgi:hypothetical protein
MRSIIVTGLLIASVAPAQWALQDSHSKASLRGIDAVSDQVAWASGTQGTVLRTTDGGQTWQACPTPPDAEALDFRAVQAFNADSAVVMSAGKGALSRIYKTTDACRTWKLTFTNPDEDGFWDALQFRDSKSGVLVGDPVKGYFPIFLTDDGGVNWHHLEPRAIPAEPMQGLFAASNTSLFADTDGSFAFLTGGGVTAFAVVRWKNPDAPSCKGCVAISHVPLADGSDSTGGFSVASQESASRSHGHKRDIKLPGAKQALVAVGGDYKAPEKTEGTAAYAIREKDTVRWQVPDTFPGGYRSAVAYDASTKTWITVGPTGTDASTDDGHSWHPLKPSADDAPDADQHWNALSSPFVVGSGGRIGKLRRELLKPEQPKGAKPGAK